MKHGVEMDSGAMIYVTKFQKGGSGIQKLTRGIHRYIDTQIEGDIISLFLFC
jgi:hypothetical protein